MSSEVCFVSDEDEKQLERCQTVKVVCIYGPCIFSLNRMISSKISYRTRKEISLWFTRNCIKREKRRDNALGVKFLEGDNRIIRKLIFFAHIEKWSCSEKNRRYFLSKYLKNIYMLSKFYVKFYFLCMVYEIYYVDCIFYLIFPKIDLRI